MALARALSLVKHTSNARECQTFALVASAFMMACARFAALSAPTYPLVHAGLHFPRDNGRHFGYGPRYLNKSNTMTLHIDIPESIAASLSLPQPEVQQRLRTELAIALYAQGILSFGTLNEACRKVGRPSDVAS